MVEEQIKRVARRGIWADLTNQYFEDYELLDASEKFANILKEAISSSIMFEIQPSLLKNLSKEAEDILEYHNKYIPLAIQQVIFLY